MSVVLGEICQSFYALGTAVVAAVLARHDVPTRRVVDGHERIFAALGRGEVDLVAAAWLPHSHGAYVDACSEAALRLATVCTGGRLLWGVPSYVDAALAGIADLARPDIAQRMDKTIRGVNPDSGIMRSSVRALELYGLAAAGYRVVSGGTEAWMAHMPAAAGSSCRSGNRTILSRATARERLPIHWLCSAASRMACCWHTAACPSVCRRRHLPTCARSTSATTVLPAWKNG
jgi:hypothetical protein